MIFMSGYQNDKTQFALDPMFERSFPHFYPYFYEENIYVLVTPGQPDIVLGEPGPYYWNPTVQNFAPNQTVVFDDDILAMLGPQNFGGGL